MKIGSLTLELENHKHGRRLPKRGLQIYSNSLLTSWINNIINTVNILSTVYVEATFTKSIHKNYQLIQYQYAGLI